MKIFQSPKTLQKEILFQKKMGKSIAFVPTMGFLHEGHLRLVDMAKRRADLVVVSIFVNPLQFGPKEDLKTYPKDHKSDFKKLSDRSVDCVFVPHARDMYLSNFQTSVQVHKLTQDLCGLSRPGHFDGVATVVLKLFNIVQPNIAIFGKKDYQQYLVIRQMVEDLSLPIQIVGAPLVREKDGLAMSSRNVRLSPSDRQSALKLSQSLFVLKKHIHSRLKTTQIEKLILSVLKGDPFLQVEYVAVRHADTLQPLSHYTPRKTLVALAARVGSVRLIDNIVV